MRDLRFSESVAEDSSLLGTLCRLVNNHRLYEGSYSFHLQGKKRQRSIETQVAINLCTVHV